MFFTNYYDDDYKELQRNTKQQQTYVSLPCYFISLNYTNLLLEKG